MKKLKSFKIFEAAPRIPKLTEKGLDYWKSKGKRGKDVMIYAHDDMDGIFSAIAVKSRMLDLGYNIVGYGLLDYMTSWKNTSINPEMINVAVDFAEMPKNDRKDLIDIYIDHHGEYSETEKENYKENPVIKTKTGSAYEGICQVIGSQIDMITLYSIDMIDSAKYDEYHVDWRDILDFSWEKFIKIAKKEGKVNVTPFKGSKGDMLGWPIIAKLTFAGAFNQFLKRSDYKTIIEVIDNVKDPSIYAIYLAMKKIYPGNNIWKKSSESGEKDFVEDSQDRLQKMQSRTRGAGSEVKQIFNSQREYADANAGGQALKGYQIIGNLMFVPTGTWANALRARSILMTEYDNGVIPEDHKVNFIMLQYGNTLQICSVEKMDKISDLPVIKGVKIENLGKYMSDVLGNFQKYFGYYEPNTEIGQDELTVSGGHIGIGTISNVVGKVNQEKANNKFRDLLGSGEDREIVKAVGIGRGLVKKFNGRRFLDLIKNKIIADLSGLNELWPISFKWSGGDGEMRGQMIRDIVNKHSDYVKMVKDFVKLHANQFRDENHAANTEKKRIREEVLSEMDDKEIKDLHAEAMMDSKVMMKSDVRQIDKRGNIPSREDWEKRKIKPFGEQ